jgi:hypothetical protein
MQGSAQPTSDLGVESLHRGGGGGGRYRRETAPPRNPPRLPVAPAGSVLRVVVATDDRYVRMAHWPNRALLHDDMYQRWSHTSTSSRLLTPVLVSGRKRAVGYSETLPPKHCCSLSATLGFN